MRVSQRSPASEVDRILGMRRRVLGVVVGTGVVGTLAAGVGTSVSDLVISGTLLVGLLGVLVALVRRSVAVATLETVVLGLLTVVFTGVVLRELGTAPDRSAAEAVFELSRWFRFAVLLAVLTLYVLPPRVAVAVLGVVLGGWVSAWVATVGTSTGHPQVDALAVTMILFVVITVAVLYAMAASTVSLRMTERDLTSALALRRRIEAMTAHDLRSPLSVVRGTLETLATTGDRLDPGARSQLIGAALRSVDRITAMSDDLVGDVHDRLPAQAWAPVPLREVLEAAVSQSRVSPDDVEVEADPGTASLPQGAVVRLLVNLLDNAAKYGAPPITVRGSTLDGVTRLVVQDAGPGLPTDVAGSAFDSYTRGQVHRELAGVGLGLAIVQQLATSFGGQVELAPGSSRFTVTVPGTPPAPTEVE